MTLDRDPETMTKRRRIVLAAAIVVLLLAVVLIWRGCHKTAAEEEANVVVSVQVAKAERGAIAI